MNSKLKAIVSYTALSAALAMPLSLQAHEPRANVSGTYNLVIGFDSEPAYKDQPNAFQLTVRDLNNEPVEIDSIELDVDALLLREDAPDARVRVSMPLTGELTAKSDQPNRFTIPFIPVVDGAYGFDIKGSINGVAIDERFVCGGGSIHPDGNAFGCVTEMQRFPAFPYHDHSKHREMFKGLFGGRN